MITVVLLYGGNSPEYSVSLRSAETVFQYLDRSKFKVTTVHITQSMHWLVQPEGEEAIEYASIPSYLPGDVVLSMMHGSLGENGSIQGLLNIWGIPYIGSDLLGSALAMDKILAKEIVSSASITSVAPFLYFNQRDWYINHVDYIESIEKLGYPVFVKPSNSGSSIGIQKIQDSCELPQAIKNALIYDQNILVEKALPTMRELEIGVLESAHDSSALLVSVAGEVLTSFDFYSYEAKYAHSDSTHFKIPADLSALQYHQLETISKRIFKILRLKHMARIDFFFIEEEKIFYFNEVNTLPGFTETSMYPKLWEASGKPLKLLLTELIELALQSC